MVPINVVPEFVPHDKLELRPFERLEQARGEHHTHPIVLGLEASRVELGASVRVELVRGVNFQTLGAVVGHTVDVGCHAGTEPHRGCHEPAPDPRWGCILVAGNGLIGLLDFTVLQQRLVHVEIVSAPDPCRVRRHPLSPRSVCPLEDGGNALPAADAHGLEPITCLATL